MPQEPNYNRGTGRLTTDRFDFEKHTNGTDSRHDGYDIDMVPAITIGGNPYSNVRSAIDALNAIIAPATIQDATGVVKGILRLAGDFGGTATTPKVIGLQSRPVSALAPTNGQILTWNGTSNVWEPQTSSASFVAAGDLTGTNVSQQVVSLTGTGASLNVRIVSANAGTIAFNTATTAPVITQTDTASTAGAALTVRAQNTTGVNQDGGFLVLSGGARDGIGIRGGVRMRMNGGAVGETMLELAQPINNQRVLSLVNAASLTSTQMPANTGDMVVYIANTATPPTSGSPVGGVIMYSESGLLKIKQTDGIVVPVGSIPNPSTWGPSTAQTYSRQFTLTTSNASPTNTIVFNLPDNTSTKLDVLVVARNTAAAQSAQFNMTMGYVRSGGAPVAIGGVTSSDPRSTAGATTWASTITAISNDAVVTVTGEAGKTINWFIIIQAMTVT